MGSRKLIIFYDILLVHCYLSNDIISYHKSKTLIEHMLKSLKILYKKILFVW